MKRSFFLLLTVFALQAAVFAQVQKRQQSFNISSKQVGIHGYDPVAYFNQGKAISGRSSYAVSYEGITYFFSTAENKAAFLAEPAKFEPQYGGWCAYAMGAKGEKVDVDPETFKILNGKLFLFYNKYFNNTLNSWNKDEKTLHEKADINWTKLYPGKP